MYIKKEEKKRKHISRISQNFSGKIQVHLNILIFKNFKKFLEFYFIMIFFCLYLEE